MSLVAPFKLFRSGTPIWRVGRNADDERLTGDALEHPIQDCVDLMREIYSCHSEVLDNLHLTVNALP